MKTQMNTELFKKDCWDEKWEKVNLPLKVNKFRYIDYRLANLFRETCLHEKNPNMKVLEVGCGASKWMHYFYNNLKIKNVFGFDYSEIGCRLTRKNLILFNDEKAVQNVICGDIFHSPFKNESFDIIYSLGLIEHFENPFEILELVNRLLKIGGILITLVPNLDGFCGWLKKYVDPFGFNMHHVIALKELNNWYNLLKLETVHLNYFGNFLFPSDVSCNIFYQKSILRYILLRIIMRSTNALITLPLRVINIKIESKLFSPFLVGVGRKQE